MTELVPAEKIETIVGRERHATAHYGRAVSEEDTLYILHSQHCLETRGDLRECIYSLALDNGLRLRDWGRYVDMPMRLAITETGRLVPDTK